MKWQVVDFELLAIYAATMQRIGEHWELPIPFEASL
jgi:hypothetical protein